MSAARWSGWTRACPAPRSPRTVVLYLTEAADAAQNRESRAVAATSGAAQGTWRTHTQRAIAVVVLLPLRTPSPLPALCREEPPPLRGTCIPRRRWWARGGLLRLGWCCILFGGRSRHQDGLVDVLAGTFERRLSARGFADARCRLRVDGRPHAIQQKCCGSPPLGCGSTYRVHWVCSVGSL
jgi:hypothetical protein